MNFKPLENKLEIGVAPIFKYAYFLPNHDLNWTRNILKILRNRITTGRLLVVGYYYASIIKSTFPELKVIAIDADPLNLLSNAFVVWLKLYKKLEFTTISKIIFLDFYKPGKRLKELKTELSVLRYFYSYNFFKEFFTSHFFCGVANENFIEYLFRTIFRVKKHGSLFILNRAPKGVCADILRYPLKTEPDEIIIKNLIDMRGWKKYHIIISNNAIDFSKNKDEFLKNIKSLLTKNGLAEISSYNKKTRKKLKKICKNKKTFLGTGVFYKMGRNRIGYVRKSIYLDEITYILKNTQ